MLAIAPIIPFKEAPGRKGSYIILRHDVDLDLYPAFKLSRIENQLGIKSTFFIMTSCQNYNPLSATNRKLLNDIQNDGHEIGLHFDPSIYHDSSIKDLNKKAKEEVLLMESVIDRKIHSVSLHNPTELGYFPHIEGLINAYENPYFSKENYISDSYMDRSFINKNPFEFIFKAKDSPCQVLLHPCHYTEDGKSFNDIVAESLSRLESHTEKAFRNLLK